MHTYEFISQWKLVTFVVCLFLFTKHYAEMQKEIKAKKSRQHPFFVVSCLVTVNSMSHVGKNKLTTFIATSESAIMQSDLIIT